MDFYDMNIFFISFSIQKFQKCSKWKAEMNFTINQLGKFFTPKTSVVLVKQRREYMRAFKFYASLD